MSWAEASSWSPLGLSLWFLAAWLRRVRMRLRQADNDRIAAGIMTDLRASPAAHVPEFYLYLRAFETTGRLHVPLFLRLRRYSVGLRQLVTDDVESYVSDAIRKVGPLIALGRAGEAIGAGRIVTNDEKWQADIRVLMDRARAILVVPSDRPGTMWEMDTLKTANLLHKVIFIMPPRSKGDLDTRERWELARQALIGHGLEPPPYDDRGLLFEVAPDGRICNIEPMLLTSPRQVTEVAEAAAVIRRVDGRFPEGRGESRTAIAPERAVPGWSETTRLFSLYAFVVLALFAARPEVGFNPAESWSMVWSRSMSAKTQREYDDSFQLAASTRYRELEAQVPRGSIGRLARAPVDRRIDAGQRRTGSRVLQRLRPDACPRRRENVRIIRQRRDPAEREGHRDDVHAVRARHAIPAASGPQRCWQRPRDCRCMRSIRRPGRRPRRSSSRTLALTGSGGISGSIKAWIR